MLVGVFSASLFTSVVRYSVIVMSYPSASSMIVFFVWAGILIVSVVVFVVGLFGGRPGLPFAIWVL